MSSPSPRQPAVGFIFVTLALAIVGFGLLIPVLPELVKGFKDNNETDGAHAYGMVVSIYALMQFIGSPILGSLSDRFGRRRIILIATAGSAIDYVIMATASSLSWLIVARIIAGFTAGVYATANAYIADVTPPEKRAGAFGLLGAAFGIGFIVGPVLGGFLGQISLRLPFWVAAGCSAANWFWGLLVLPESLKPENRRPFSFARANPIGALLALKRLPAVLGLAESYFILMVAQTMMFSMWKIYVDYRYHWSLREVGLSLMFVGVLSGIVQAVLVKKIVPALGETRSVIIGLTISALAYICYGLAPYGWMIYVIMTVGAFAGISGPALQAYITKHVPPNEQGAAQGVLGGLQSLAGIPGPLIATWSFGWAISTDPNVHLPDFLSFLDGTVTWIVHHLLPKHPGVTFFESAFLILTAMLLALRSFRKDAAVAAKAAQP